MLLYVFNLFISGAEIAIILFIAVKFLRKIDLIVKLIAQLLVLSSVRKRLVARFFGSNSTTQPKTLPCHFLKHQ